jgi:hypothetical protein
MNSAPELPLAGLIWRQPDPSPEEAARDLQALANGALRLARWSRQPDEKRAFEELAAGAIRLAR